MQRSTDAFLEEQLLRTDLISALLRHLLLPFPQTAALTLIDGSSDKLDAKMTQAKEPIAHIKAILFDMDGLLIDSEGIYTKVVNDILKPYGKEQTWEIKANLMGKPEREATCKCTPTLR